MTEIAELLRAQLGPWYRKDLEDPSHPLLDLTEACIGGLQPIEDIIRDTDDGPGWSQILDPDRAPADWLPWLAQMGGTRIPPGLTEDAQRQAIKNLESTHRGTPAAIINAAQRNLVGLKRVYLIERQGGAWRLGVAIMWEDFPETDRIRTNVVVNPDADNGLVGVSAASGTATAVANPISTGVNTGGNVWRHVADATGQPMMFTQQYDALPGQKWSAYAQMAPAVSGQNFHVEIRYLDSGGATISTTSGTIKTCTTNIFNEAILEGVQAPSGTAKVILLARSDGTAPTSGNITYFDRFRLAPQLDLGPDGSHRWADGDMVDSSNLWAWTWDGTANNSPSHRINLTKNIENAVRAQKPAGLVLTFRQLMSTSDYTTLTAMHASYSVLTGIYTTYADVLSDPARQ